MNSGEMTRRIREHDWAATPLGSIRDWPQSLRTAVDIMLASPGPVSILWGSGGIQLYNDAYVPIAAERHPACLGRPAFETWAEAYEGFLGPILARAMAGEAVTVTDQAVLLRSAPGMELEERVFTASFSPIRSEAGTVSGVFHPLIETTEQHRLEAHRRESKERLHQGEERVRAVLETARDYAILTTDAEGRIDTWSAGAEAVLGWRAEEAVGQSIDIAFTPEDRARGVPAQERQEARTKGQAPDVRWHLRQDGTRVFIEGIVRRLTSPDGTLTGFVKVGHDVTERRATERALHDSEARFRMLASAVEDVFYVTDLTRWQLDYLSPSYETVWGRPVAELMENLPRFLEALHPEDRGTFLDGRAAQQRGEPVAKEYRIVRPDGAIRWIFDRSFPVPGREHTHAAGVASDITDRKQAEQALRELNATLEAKVAERTAERDRVWRLSRDLLVVVGTDGVFRAVNPAWTAILGHAPEQVVGRSFRDFIWPEDAERTQVGLDEAAASHDLTSFENRYRHKDGSPRWISWHTSVEGDRVYAYGRDVTAEKDRQTRLEAAEAARRQADALYRTYFENTAEALFVIGVLPDGGFTIEELNPAHQAASGFDLRTVRGQRVEKQLPPEIAEAVAAHYRRAVELGRPINYREVLDLPGGLRHWDTILMPVKGEDGRVTRIIGSARDITAQVQAEEQLRQGQKMEAMGQLTGGVAHDFNNLLTPILGGLDRLQRKGVGSERDQRLIEGALQSAERAKTLVQRLLAFARRQPLQPRAVDVAGLVHGMADLIGSTTGPQIRVAVEVAPDLRPALADANQLEMALLNLAVNARDAMPEGGTLRISAINEVVGPGTPAGAAPPGHYVRLSVADTGTGMDKTTLARAVEPFFSTKGIGRGTGLGLSMVHGLAAQLGGALRIRSKPGLGTNVELWLPVAKTYASAEAQEFPVAEQDSPSTGRGTVLLVDDEDLVRATTADMLADLGYAVVEAGSAEEALRHLDGGLVPDLLVTDHLMPGLTGTELARTVQSRWPACPVLVISGYADDEGIAPDLTRLTKPFRRADLAQSLTQLTSSVAS